MTKVSAPARGSAKGLRQFLDAEQQRAWLEGEAMPPDAAERSESLEQRFKYVARFEKLLRRPQGRQVLDILRLYGATCLPIPRTTERTYWSVSCLPSTSDKPLARVNASWMELFTLLPDRSSPLVDPAKASPLVGEVGGGRPASAGQESFLLAPSAKADAAPPPNPPSAGIPRVHEDPWSLEARSAHKGEGLTVVSPAALRARIIMHLSDFTSDGSPDPDQLDVDLLESSAARPEDVSHTIWRNGKGILIVKVRGAASIRAFVAHPRALRAIRRFNLTHMNRGRNAYQASHCYSLADVMLGD
jgi:hypothetical protein